ncbi:steroid receptor RNA activator 1 isoform X2 [Nomia melanderi]|uniref:steroid receptor RNA activator 1 isoform X2 n=2 Tax=Nomia melanderi TaxID=2448451 RepID=UPI001304460D|nr:steroid receptor RNA activator 1-like isoform X2 [Nomia melanderi]
MYKNLSMQKVLLPGHEPGWNDPPKWAYSGAQSSTPTKRLLNKRIAFPLSSTQASNKNSSPSNTSTAMPPPLQSSVNLTTASHPPLIPPSNVDAEIDTRLPEIDKAQMLNDVLKILETVIDQHVDKNKVEEIKKRLDLLKTAWLEDKLNNVICTNVLDLSKALQEGNVEKADQIHLMLIMQHASLCSSWIPGIRHIILELRTKQQDLNTVQSSN